MANNDMHVVIFKILSYVYDCMKNGIEPDIEKMSACKLGIPQGYWNQIMREVFGRGYITGVSVVKSTDGDKVFVSNPSVTLDGVEFLMENSMMAKAKQFLQDAKSAVPFL